MHKIKSIFMYFFVAMLLVFIASPAAAKKLDFEGCYLQHVETSEIPVGSGTYRDVYEIITQNGEVFSFGDGTSVKLYALTRNQNYPPRIVSDSNGNDTLDVGNSNKTMATNMWHYVELIVTSEKPFKTVNVGYKYKNTLSVGGSARVQVGNHKNGWFTWQSKVPGHGLNWKSFNSNRDWLYTNIPTEDITTLADGKEEKVNAIRIMVVDLNKLDGGNFLDDVDVVYTYEGDSNGAVDTGVYQPSIFVPESGYVQVRFENKHASYGHQLYLHNTNELIFDTNRDRPHYSVTIGPMEPGTELIFRLDVINTGESFFTGPGVRNPDGEIHVELKSFSNNRNERSMGQNPDRIRVGFEDTLQVGIGNFSDSDFNDVVFSVTQN